MSTTAGEHFDQAIARALVYVDRGTAGPAVSSLIQDLSRHQGTAGILDPALQVMLLGEVMIDGVDGVRRFIQGLPRPGSLQ